MFEFLNPFRKVIETNTSPNSQVLRTSLFEKLGNAFVIFIGRWHLDKDSFPIIHIGLFDILTLGIPAALFALMIKASSSQNSWVRGLSVFLFILNLPFLLLRFVLGLLFVFNPVSFFIIGMVHVISEYAAGGASLKQQVVSYLKNNLMKDMREDQHTQKFKNYDDNEAVRHLQIEPSGNVLMVSAHVGGVKLALKSYWPSVFQPANAADKEEKVKFERALLQLNCGGVTEKIENLSDSCKEFKSLLNLAAS